MPPLRPARVVVATGIITLIVVGPIAARDPAEELAGPPLAAVPRAVCGPGSQPEPGMQGRAGDRDAPDRTKGYQCNVEVLGHHGPSGGYKVERFVDRAGRECAYYDTTLLFPSNALDPGRQPTGVAVLDMTDPAIPIQTTTLSTPAMQSPHESLVLNQRRGLLAAVMGNPVAYPGVVDIYDLNDDCREPVLQSSLPVGILGHESGFAPDGNTFYAASLATGDLTAVDVSNPKLPVTLYTGRFDSHGLSISDNGNRAYLAASPGFPRTEVDALPRDAGLIILDVSEIQARAPAPQTRVLSTLTWPTVSIPQNAVPVVIDGVPYVVEIDEFSLDDQGHLVANGPRVGAARIIDVSDETNPKVVSDIRLEVHQPERRAALGEDAGGGVTGGYAGHYCAVPKRDEPGIVACSFLASGLRVFDIRDPRQPKEIAYFVAPVADEGSGNSAFSGPTFVPERREIWYTDAGTGFYALRVTNDAWPDPLGQGEAGEPPAGEAAPRPHTKGTSRDIIPATADAPVALAIVLVAAALVVRSLGRRAFAGGQARVAVASSDPTKETNAIQDPTFLRRRADDERPRARLVGRAGRRRVPGRRQRRL